MGKFYISIIRNGSIRKKIFICLKVLLIIGLFSNSAEAADSIILSKSLLNGKYIGRHVEYLNEKELFLILSKEWKIKGIFKEKILSGELRSDKRIAVKFDYAQLGYKVYLNLKNDVSSACIVQWGLNDILKKDSLLKFYHSDDEILNLDFTPHAEWLRFKVQNDSSKQKKFYLELDSHFFLLFDLFIPGENGYTAKRSFFVKNIAKREQKYRNIVYEVPALPGEHYYYARVDNWFNSPVPLRIWSKDNFFNHVSIDNMILGIVAGIFLFIFLYNIFIFITIKDVSYLFLSLLSWGQLFNHMSISGFGFQFLWPHNTAMTFNVLYLSYPLSFIFLLLFCRAFIDIERHTPGVNRYIGIMISFFGFIFIASFFLPQKLNELVFGSMFITDHFYYLPVVYSCIVVIRKGNREGIYLLIGLILYFLSQLEWQLTNHNIIPYRYVNYIQVKEFSFLIIMSLGLHNKIKTINKSLAELYLKLEFRVKERTTVEIEDSEKAGESKKTITEDTKIKIDTVMEFLRDNYRDDISREGLASAVGMSPDHLGRTFKQYAGEKISDYLSRIRIEEASRQLRDTDEKVIDIAFEVGFRSLRTFNKVFSDISGESPTVYRKRCGWSE